MIEANIIRNNLEINCHLYETSSPSSNFRSFKLLTLQDYLLKISDPDTTFDEYFINKR